MSSSYSLDDLHGAAKAFVINLDSRPERMVDFHTRFDRFNMPIERISGCTPATTADWLAEADPVATAAEVACTASHHSIYQRMIDESIPWALVLEDDAVPVHDLRRRLTWLFERWPEDCWYVQLGYIRSEAMGLRGLARSLGARIMPSLNELRPDARRMGTHMSLVTLDFARHIVPLMRPGTKTIDVHLNELKDHGELGAHSYVHVPCLARQSRSPSDIQNDAHWAMKRGQRWMA